MLASCSIWALYEANELDQLDAVFDEYSETMAESAVPDFLAVGHISMARACIARGQAQRATQILDQAEFLALGNGWLRIVSLLNWERLRLALNEGGRERAQALFEQIPSPTTPIPPSWTLVSEEMVGERFGRIRLALASAELETAAALLAEKAPGESRRVYQRIRLQVLNALLLEQRGMQAPALRKLSTALKLAEPGGYIRIFLDEGDHVLRLLQLIVESQKALPVTTSEAVFAETLLEAAGIDCVGSNDPVVEQEALYESLSDREREILKLLTKRLSNREIADCAFLSENTVKYHLKNIYSKLGVKSRLEARSVADHLAL